MNLYRTVLQTSSCLTPQLKLHLMDPGCSSWSTDRYEASPFQNDPFWAIYWPGGQALTRYIFDYPQVVHGRRVLDLGCGSGATGIASMMCGAKSVIANDIDKEALRMTNINAEANGVEGIEMSSLNLLEGEGDPSLFQEVDLVCIGDMFYDHEVVESIMKFLKDFSGDVFIGDPGRWALKETRPNMRCLAKYNLPNSAKLENYGFLHGFVYKLIKS